MGEVAAVEAGVSSFDELEARSMAVLERCLSFVEEMLEAAEAMKPDDALKVINRATTVARQLIDVTRYLKKAEARGSGDGVEAADGGIDPDLLADVERRLSRLDPRQYAGEAGD